MRQYIVHLTDHLIRSNHFDQLYTEFGRYSFLPHAKHILLVGEVAKMNPETLGKIMCSFEIGDVMASSQEVSAEVCFSGDSEDFLRVLVSYCLACAIRDRLDAASHLTPKFERRP